MNPARVTEDGQVICLRFAARRLPRSREQICREAHLWVCAVIKGLMGVLILASLVGGCASPVVSAGPLHFGPTKVGTALVDDQGMTLYSYDDDKPDVPTCTGDCAYLWPPELAASEVHLSGASSVVLRPDGIAQWAYDGKPLYRYAGDFSPAMRLAMAF